MSDANGNPCLEIGPDCTIEETTYGYYPSLPANAFFAAIFGALLIIQLFQGVKWKSWTYLIALAFGCLGEAIGMMPLRDQLPLQWLANGAKVMLEESYYTITPGIRLALICKSLA